MLWWFVDRYPEKYKTTRVDALKYAVAELYKMPAGQFEDYAKYRAEAMVLHDETKKQVVDWSKIESLITRWTNLIFLILAYGTVCKYVSLFEIKKQRVRVAHPLSGVVSLLVLCSL